MSLGPIKSFGVCHVSLHVPSFTSRLTIRSSATPSASLNLTVRRHSVPPKLNVVARSAVIARDLCLNNGNRGNLVGDAEIRRLPKPWDALCPLRLAVGDAPLPQLILDSIFHYFTDES